MSAFTKILTVILSLASIFLCGVIIAYVASTNNINEKYEKLQSDYRTLQSSKNVAVARANEIRTESETEIRNLKENLARLEDEKSQAMIELTDARNTAVKWQDRVNSWAGVVNSFEQTVSEMEKSLRLTREMLNDEQSKNIKISGQLNEMAASLDEHIVMLSSLRAENRRLLEQKAAIEKKLEEPAPVHTVTQVRDRAMPSFEPTAYVQLTGLVTEVGENIVAISLGSSDGVKKGMKFHITRGTTFVCDIEITDVDVDVAAGVITLKRQSPRVGDTASNEL